MSAQEAPEEAGPQTDEDKQKAAGVLFQEGKAAAEAKDYDTAVKKFEAAFDLYSDPGLMFLVGESFQLWGNDAQAAGNSEAATEYYRKAVEAYKKFVELTPDDPSAAEATIKARNEALSRIEKVGDAVKQWEDGLKAVEDEEAQAKAQEEEAKKAEEEELRAEEEALRGFQKAVDASVLAGADEQLSGIMRIGAGAVFGWSKFAFDAHVGLDGFLRVDADQGVSARSFTLIDLGARYGLGHHFVGPFVSGGGSFGLFTGKPRERKLKDDDTTCPGYDTSKAGQCAFNIDKNIATRLGVGYGFEASENTTVALRLEAQYWWFSVDGTQEIGSPPAGAVEKPQNAAAILLGLEFMRWL